MNLVQVKIKISSLNFANLRKISQSGKLLMLIKNLRAIHSPTKSKQSALKYNTLQHKIKSIPNKIFFVKKIVTIFEL